MAKTTKVNKLRRNMARVLVSSGQFNTRDIDRALNLPAITCAGFAANAARYGKKILTRFE